MSVDRMREAIAEVYDGPKWKKKVANMPDYQVIAVYYSFVENDRFGKNKPKKVQGKKPEKKEEFTPYQLSFEDII